MEGIFRTYHGHEGRTLSNEPSLVGGNSTACTGGAVTYVMAFDREYVKSWQEFVKGGVVKGGVVKEGGVFKCHEPGCEYASADRSNLKRHMRTHTGEKPYKCDEPGCEYASADKTGLNTCRHMCTCKMKKGK